MDKVQKPNNPDCITSLSEPFRIGLYSYSRTWLYNIARGIDSDPVTKRLVSKSVGCCKKFPGRQALTTKTDVCSTHCSSDIPFSGFLQSLQATAGTVPKIGFGCLFPFHIIIYKHDNICWYKMIKNALLMNLKLLTFHWQSICLLRKWYKHAQEFYLLVTWEISV